MQKSKEELQKDFDEITAYTVNIFGTVGASHDDMKTFLENVMGAEHIGLEIPKEIWFLVQVVGNLWQAGVGKEKRILIVGSFTDQDILTKGINQLLGGDSTKTTIH